VPSAAHSCSLVTPHASSAMRTSAASLATTDLWAELERRRKGEDGRITIECRRERHRNLVRDFDAVDTTPVTQAACTPTSLGSGEVAWHFPHTSAWRSGRASSGPTCHRSTTGVSTPPSSCRSTPPLSSLQEGCYGQLLPYGPDRHNSVMAHETTLGVPHLQGRVVPPVHSQLRERLRSPQQRGQPPRRAATPGESHYGPSSSCSFRFKTISPTSPTLLSLSHFGRA
jgi:hypothetical protein